MHITERSIYLNRTVSKIELPTALLEYIDLVLQITLVLGFTSYLCNNYNIILVAWYNYNINCSQQYDHTGNMYHGSCCGS